MTYQKNELESLVLEKTLILDGATGSRAPVAHVWDGRECAPGSPKEKL